MVDMVSTSEIEAIFAKGELLVLLDIEVNLRGDYISQKIEIKKTDE